jgi:hypothetical protein
MEHGGALLNALVGDGCLSIPDLEAPEDPPPLALAGGPAAGGPEEPNPAPVLPAAPDDDRSSSPADPLEAVRRRRLNDEPPVTWDPGGPARELLEVPLFARGPGPSSTPGPCRPRAAAECRAILAAAFRGSLGLQPPRALRALVDELASRSLYEILSISRLQHPARHAVHRHFACVYALDAPRRVYHGTTAARAAAIARHGFRAAASLRAKFGRGIYSTSDIWEAFYYAEPDPVSGVQTVLIADLFQGPSAVGAENLADFGVDAHGAPVLTTTNPEATVFCAAYEDQLYPHYLVTARFQVERLGESNTVTFCVGTFNPAVWRLIQAARNACHPPSRPLFALKAPAPAPTAVHASPALPTSPALLVSPASTDPAPATALPVATAARKRPRRGAGLSAAHSTLDSPISQ